MKRTIPAALAALTLVVNPTIGAAQSQQPAATDRARINMVGLCIEAQLIDIELQVMHTRFSRYLREAHTQGPNAALARRSMLLELARIRESRNYNNQILHDCRQLFTRTGSN